MTDRRRFRLKSKLGAGAFVEVWLAELRGEEGFARLVALKLLHPNVATHADARRRLRDEARVLGRLSHRHIVAVLDFVRISDRWAIVMDYVPGADLDAVLAVSRDGIPGKAALEVASAMLDALDGALQSTSENGEPLQVIHRDIKPSNVRLTQHGDVKVLDFGVARFNLESREGQSKVRGWIGTENYMAPERLLAQGDTPAGDVYSAAATTVELIVGSALGRSPVHHDRHAELVDTALAQVRQRLEGPVDVVDAVVTLLGEMLAPRPEARPSARQAADELAALGAKLDGDALRAFAHRVVWAAEQAVRSSMSEVERVDLGSLRVAGPGLGALTLWGTEVSRDNLLFAVGGAASGIALVAGVLGLGSVVTASILYLGLQTTAPEAQAVPQDPPAAEMPVGRASVRPVPEVAPKATPRAAAPEPPPIAAPSQVPTDSSTPAVARVARAHFSALDASSLHVSCGDVEGTGTQSLRLVAIPAGTCIVDATYLGSEHRAEVEVNGPVGVRCHLTELGALACR